MAVCKMCDRVLGKKNKSGYCLRHQNQNPEKKSKISAAMTRVYMEKPHLIADRRQMMKERTADPQWKALAAQRCREIRMWEHGLPVAHAPAARARQGQTFSRRHGVDAWCPPELKEMYFTLRKQKIDPDECKRIVLDHHDAEMAKFRRRVANSKRTNTDY